MRLGNKQGKRKRAKELAPPHWRLQIHTIHKISKKARINKLIAERISDTRY